MSDFPGSFMMIGLHKLAAERGDGLIPELLALYAARRDEPVAPELIASATGDTPSTYGPTNDNVVDLRTYRKNRQRRQGA